ncbi:AraC family transcriptional regulator [Ramlibacter sp. WS9]|uniref:AraC family transcriptional regulator n=1 Tax=Ramlibacter sp. WS9 TaxID=1882741 RepID=UPI00114329EC|nr:AraC family transcriptional regulator [Ramlibacter sp. WS9]ROZ66552.1 AraC family transcriptional regulator [Ramlibacter sp. WS9]
MGPHSARARPEPTGLALGAQRLMAHACARGAERAALLRAMGPGAGSLEDPDERLPTRCYYNLIAAAAQALDDPWFGIHYLETAQPADIGAVGFAAVTSASYAEALARVARYLGFLTQSEQMVLTPEPDGMRVSWRLLGPEHPAHAMVSEMYAYNVTGLASRLLGVPVVPRSLAFRHMPRAPRAQYARMFGCEPGFGAAEDACRLDACVLEHPMPQADVAMAAFFDRWLAGRTPAPVLTLRRELEQALLGSLSQGVPGIEALAGRMCISARTLQRRLAEEGLTLRALAEDVRRRVALQQVGAGVPLAEVCYLLGFADTRSFFRAFRRWTGQSPAAWRAEGARRQ